MKEDKSGHQQPDWEAPEGKQTKTNIRRAGHHQPGWQTNERKQVKTDIRGHHQSDMGGKRIGRQIKTDTQRAGQGDKWRQVKRDIRKAGDK